MPEALTIASIFRSKRNAAAVRFLAARTVGLAAAVEARAAILPADAADQRAAVLLECKRAVAEARRLASMTAGMADGDPVDARFAAMFALLPGAKSPAGYTMITPIPLWPVRAARMVEALEEHASDMEGAFLRLLAQEVARLPETASKAATDLVEAASSSWLPVAGIVVGGTVSLGVLYLVSRRIK